MMRVTGVVQIAIWAGPGLPAIFDFQAGEKSSGGLEDEYQAVYQS
jgi:hypothetical protein